VDYQTADYLLTNPVVCIVGLGYVGLPLAQAFSKSFKVVGFDTDAQKVSRLTSRQPGSQQLTSYSLIASSRYNG